MTKQERMCRFIDQQQASGQTYHTFLYAGQDKIEISEEKYKQVDKHKSKKTIYNSTFIFLGLIAGTAGGYLMYDQINELREKTKRKKNNRSDLT